MPPPLPSQKKQLSSKAYSVGIWGSVPLGFVKSMVLGGFWAPKGTARRPPERKQTLSPPPHGQNPDYAPGRHPW